MYSIALKMLFGDRTKYLGLVFGVTFASLLLLQQVSIFIGLLERAASVIRDVRESDVWVMDPSVKTLDVAYPLRETELSRVRGVEGVAWAVPFFKAQASVRTREGSLENSLILGVDDASLVGVPDSFVEGSVENLWLPEAIVVDTNGYQLLFPNQPFEMGRTIEINDKRAVIVGLIDCSAAFSANLIIYSRYSLATQYTNNGRNQLSFILVKANSDQTPNQVAERVSAETGLKALTNREISNLTIGYILENTGIPISFGTVVLLGIIVGIAIVGLTFNQFIMENIKQYAALKAMGVRNSVLATMTLVQAFFVGIIGYGLGLGLASLFFTILPAQSAGLRGFYLPWYIGVGVFVVAMMIVFVSTLISLRRVLYVDPATVFRG
ncbi:MAG: FtsX-like permease family protein [Sumerlaeia bacterium]